MRASFRQLLSDIKADPNLINQFRADPETALQQYEKSQNPKEWDAWIYRIVVLALGLTLLLIVTGVLITLIKNIEVKNENLITIVASIGSAAIGAHGRTTCTVPG